ncbi:histidine kinase [Mycobacterium sp. OTB74]|uniref:sensor histidine kinase n=1 Tax=Mycobacterium sp. OTB74 TaxID=1853452 RepID=UPI002475D7FB|nr:histidine kinase [Mycobacterium sp. OTB74]MDH6243815.1 signal transduction histidine kinase [Mycobacterium sp. OTB74]
MDRLRDIAMRRRALVPFDFPFTVPVVMYTGTLLLAGTAMVQRGFTHPWLLALAFLLSIGPIVVFAVIGVKPVPLLAAASLLTAVGIFLSWPPVTNDAAPFLLMFMLGEVFALGSVLHGAIATAAAAALLTTASRLGHLGIPVAYLLFFLAIAAMIGRILQLQQRLVLQERDQQAHLAERAAADERRRIAREVHDVIAHSLSVTMLHLTGARRALQEDNDVDDAVDGLLDAERLGRQAMSDIRRTVGLLGTEPRDATPARLTPEPGMADIPELVASFAAAGLRIDSHIDPAPDTVTAGIGLALYRVTQESLANIAKHAPQSDASLQLTVGAGVATLCVHNVLPPGLVHAPQSGSGLAGMRQRIEVLDGQFRAGPGPHGWTVQATVPVTTPGLPCAKVRNRLLRNETNHD